MYNGSHHIPNTEENMRGGRGKSSVLSSRPPGKGNTNVYASSEVGEATREKQKVDESNRTQVITKHGTTRVTKSKIGEKKKTACGMINQ